jgi:DNA-binding MarR family transcriptional regulator
MRRATLEFNYEDAWKKIFGIYANKVDLLQALKCFKCDTQGLALICRIKLKDNKMTIKELQGKGLLTKVEVLYKEKDGSLVVFIDGKSCVPPPPNNVKPFQVMMSKPPEFLDIDKMKVEVIGKETEMQKFLSYTSTLNSRPFKLIGLSTLEPRQESHLANLTGRQRQALITAYSLGYYDVPRKVSSEEVSRHLNIDKSTFVEHLRKAERKIVAQVIAK